ncbi:MAG: hypothetical protein D6801_02600 [Alphaproteobacteria bacterium]|nr:MAG: hypothetical protein D6801_02600 [Alphaproteobacteria bacterium]
MTRAGVHVSREAALAGRLAAHGHAPVATHQRDRHNRNHPVADAGRAEELRAAWDGAQQERAPA